MSPTKHSRPRLSLTDLLRQRLLETGKAYIQLERETGILRQNLMAFMKGRQYGLRADAIEKLMDYFKLEVIETDRPKRQRKKGG